jgi:hypothetical protein
MQAYARQAGGRPLAAQERHPVLAYYLDRPDLEFVATPSAAATFIRDRQGFVVVDLETREVLARELEGFVISRLLASDHTYVLLGPPEKPDSRR